MSTATASYWRDANRVPITTDGIVTTDTQSLTANNTTANVPIFGITGVVEMRALWGIITTTLSSNITAAYWRLNDGSTTSAISLATGTTISNYDSGSFIGRKSPVASALVGIRANQEQVADTATNNVIWFTPTILMQKTGAVATNVEFTYSTTNQPATGAIQFFIRWLPLSANGNVTAQ